MSDMTLEDALEKVVLRLERGEITHVQTVQQRTCSLSSLERSNSRQFNMRVWRAILDYDHPECGTVCCLGGFCQEVLGRRLSESEIRKYDRLFHPFRTEKPWGDITTAEAARAARNALAGDLIDPWKEVLR